MLNKVQAFVSELKEPKYDIFISYRRDGGYAHALAVKESLSKRGFRVFLDVEGLRSGEFNKQLYKVIDRSKDVLIICSPNSLDRCKNEGDWVRNEIAHAIQKKKNIIPIMIDQFCFPAPEELPEGIRTLPNYQALTPGPLTYEESMQKLASKYLKSKPQAKYSVRMRALLLCAMLAVLFVGVLVFKNSKALPDEVVAAIDQNCAYALGKIHRRADACLTGLEKCREYLDGEINASQLRELLKYQQKEMESVIAPADIPSLPKTYEGIDFYTELLTQAENSDVDSRYLDFAEWLVLESNKIPSACKRILDNIEQIVRKDYLNALNRIFGAFLPITDRLERKDNGDYRYSTIYMMYYYNAGISNVADMVRSSLFGNSNDTISYAGIHELINNSANPVTEIENELGQKWREIVKKEL